VCAELRPRPTPKHDVFSAAAVPLLHESASQLKHRVHPQARPGRNLTQVQICHSSQVLQTETRHDCVTDAQFHNLHGGWIYLQLANNGLNYCRLREIHPGLLTILQGHAPHHSPTFICPCSHCRRSIQPCRRLIGQRLSGLASGLCWIFVLGSCRIHLHLGDICPPDGIH